MIIDISARGKLPIIVGGTGFYLQSLLAGYQFGPADNEPDMAYRQAWFDRAAVEGSDVAWMALKQRDPQAATAIAPLTWYGSYGRWSTCIQRSAFF